MERLIEGGAIKEQEITTHLAVVGFFDVAGMILVKWVEYFLPYNTDHLRINHSLLRVFRTGTQT